MHAGALEKIIIQSQLDITELQHIVDELSSSLLKERVEAQDKELLQTTQQHEKDPESDGGSAVQVYAKESSKLMVEFIKTGPRPKEDRETVPELIKTDHVFDISGGRRPFIEAEEAKELLKPLKEPGNKSQGNLVELYLMNAAVCELIPSTNKLKVLHFHHNKTGDEGAIAISQLVKGSTNLEDFNYLNLEDEGTIAIANALKTSKSSLEIIEMAGNNISFKAANAIADCMVSKKHSLTKINLSGNKLKDDGAIAIGKALEDDFGRLCIVDLSANGLRSDGAMSLAEAVSSKVGFRLLNIIGNFLSDKVIDDVKEIFKNFPRMLGPLDDNDPHGKGDEDGHDNFNELESKLKDLEMKQKEQDKVLSTVGHVYVSWLISLLPPHTAQLPLASLRSEA
ncbi:hypothetical protein L1987_82895 [Smallanthus sonchifolius]|uniref:Uncharacterized protein n=1 Tax=Smallanthus sonchifolius TaxID=185202 RepID=A0ACB8YBD3_9ASTR|nr:hypothetical protein L1987_82895 [Smallanthus sonchifolius]